MIKSLRIACLCIAMTLTSACATLGATAVDVLGTPSPSVSTVGNKVVLEGTRALVVAHNAYQGAAAAVTPFVAAKRFPPATVDRIEALNERAVFLLEKGDAGLSAAERAAGVLAITSELNRLIGR